MIPIPIPRFQGKALKLKKGWSWELFVTFLGDSTGDLYSTRDIFKSKQEAVKNMKVVIADMIKTFELLLKDKLPSIQIDSSKYVDLKTNEIRSFGDEH